MMVTPRSFSLISSVDDLVDLGLRQAGHRLVGDQQLRVGRHGAGQFELAHLDLGQIARQLVGLGREPDQAQQFVAAVVDLACGEMRAARAHATV